jgi:conjugative transfer signal peptidase TraF
MKRRVTVLLIAAVALLVQVSTFLLCTPTSRPWDAIPETLLPKLLLWNASASVPRGLYFLRAARPLHIGELVSLAPPNALAGLLAARGYLPLGVPLLKHIAALSGQTVCRHARTVTIDGRAVVVVRERDTQGRPLPSWRGCRLLRDGDVFLLNPAVPDSFDGRYFGALPANRITARAEPLWTISEH